MIEVTTDSRIPPDCGCFDLDAIGDSKDARQAYLAHTHKTDCPTPGAEGSYTKVTSWMGEPEYVGRIPARSELTVLSADEHHKLNIGWTVEVYDGAEVHLVPVGYALGDAWPANYDLEPVTFQEGLQEGDLIEFWGWVGTVQKSSETGELSVLTPSGTIGLLRWDADGRHSWTCPAVINASTVKAMMLWDSDR